MKRLVPWLLSLPGVVGAAALALNASQRITLTDWGLYLTVAAVAFRPLADLGINTVNELRDSKRHKKEESIAALLKAGLREIVNANPALKWDHTGINAYVVKKARVPWREDRLVRLWREKFAVSHPSGVTWTRGKGVIGKCWEERQDVGRNFARDYGRLVNCTEEQWNRQPERIRQGLSYAEFRRTRDHGAVVATPILSADAKFLGYISIDAPGDCYDVLWSDSVRDKLRDVAHTVRLFL